jgi:hypothetical protein
MHRFMSVCSLKATSVFREMMIGLLLSIEVKKLEMKSGQ